MGRKLVIRSVEKTAGADRSSFAFDLLNTSAAGIHKEGAAAKKPVAPFGGIQRSDLYGIQTAEPVFLRKLNRNLALIRFAVKN